MSNTLIKTLGILFLSLCFAFTTVSAQKRVVKSTTKKNAIKRDALQKKKGISAKDRAAIKALFKNVPPSKYRLQFDNKRDVMGRKAVRMSDVKQVRKFVNPVEAAGWIVLIVEGDDVIYVLAVGGSDLVSVLGRQKATQLNKIMAKYK